VAKTAEIQPEDGKKALLQMRANRWSLTLIASSVGVTVSHLSRIAKNKHSCSSDVAKRLVTLEKKLNKQAYVRAMQ
jgi:predicted ATP-binding protein involved in virulence